MSSPSENYIRDLILSDPDCTWSYSRLKKYDDCKYAWLLIYIEETETEELFFSQFGSFVHKLYYQVLIGNITTSEALTEYLINFRKEVTAKAPNETIFKSYFSDGLNAVKNMGEFLNTISHYKVVGVEIPVDFEISGKKITGFIDLLLQDKDGNYIVVDHKSRKLKPKSKKGNLKSDLEREEYTKQLYIYAEAVNQLYGKYPKELWFNCFRNTNSIIKEEFDNTKFLEVINWLDKTVCEIKQTEKWEPSFDWFRCTNLCDCHNECEYYQMM